MEHMVVDLIIHSLLAVALTIHPMEHLDLTTHSMEHMVVDQIILPMVHMDLIIHSFLAVVLTIRLMEHMAVDLITHLHKLEENKKYSIKKIYLNRTFALKF